MKQKEIAYSIVDVFTDTRFRGNPLAVIHDGRALDGEEMQSITREFGFSETSFILPPLNAGSTAQVRIFTPGEEVPFAGHPNIGTAYIVATKQTAASWDGADELSFDELGGLVSINLFRESNQVIGAKLKAPQALEILGECSSSLVAACLGLKPDNILETRFKPCVASVGLPFAFVELSDLDALQSIELDISSFKAAAKAGPETVDGFTLCAFTVTEEDETSISVRSRVVSPLGHPVEDPATGSASGALGGLLRLGRTDDDFTVNITQGVEMGRSSQITVTIPKGEDRSYVAGKCISVASGVLTL